METGTILPVETKSGHSWGVEIDFSHKGWIWAQAELQGHAIEFHLCLRNCVREKGCRLITSEKGSKAWMSPVHPNLAPVSLLSSSFDCLRAPHTAHGPGGFSGEQFYPHALYEDPMRQTETWGLSYM